MKAGLFASALAALTYAYTVGIIAPQVKLDQLAGVHQPFSMFLFNSESSSEDRLELWVEDYQISVLYDLSFSELVSFKASQVALAAQIGHVLAWSEELADKFSAVYPKSPRSGHIQACINLLKALEIKETIVLSHDSSLYIAMSEVFNVAVEASISPDISQESLNNFVSKNLKPTGIRVIILDLEGLTASKAFNSLIAARMMKKGYAVICTSRSTYLPATILVGPLIISENLPRLASSELEYELMILKRTLSALETSPDIPDLSDSTFRIFNLNPDIILIGSIQSPSVEFTMPIIWPGNTNQFDLSTLLTIQISSLSSSINLDGTTDNINPLTFNGIYYALNKINESKILNRFVIQNVKLECGGSGYYPDLMEECLKTKQLGVAIMSSYTSSHTKGCLIALAKLGNLVPVIGSLTTSASLTSKILWPNFIRSIKPDDFLVPAFVQFLKKFNFNKVNLLYSDEPFGRDFAASMSTALVRSGITIVNSPETQAINLDIVNDQENYTKHAEAVRDSGIRPVIFISIPNPIKIVLNLMYQSGIRRGDLVLLTPGFPSNLWNEDDPTTIENRMSLVENGISFESAVYIGELGEKIKLEYIKLFGRFSNSGCLSYDSAWLLGYSLQYMLLQGKDFEDPAALNKQLRETSFYGCSGLVSIDKDSNDRRDQDVNVFNLVLLNATYTYELVLQISLTSSQLITEFEPIRWSGGRLETPSLERLNYAGCPFPEEYRHSFPEGSRLVSYLCGAFSLLTLLLIMAILLRKSLQNFVLPLKNLSEASFQDKLVQILVIVDLVQYIGHGPELSTGEDIMSPILDTVSQGRIQGLHFEKGVYWKLLNSAFAMIGLWSACCILIWMRYNSVHIRHLKGLTNLAEALMPILGNIVFMPIISVLFDLFVCEEAHGLEIDNLEYKDSFMIRDCHEDCWTGTHLNYTIAAVICLLLYLTVTTLTRPIWQLIVPDLNIITRPTFYTQKTMVEVALVSLRRGVRTRDRSIHALMYIVLIFLHLSISVLRKPFNYHRINWWFYLSMCSVTWFGVVSLAAIYTALSANTASMMFGFGIALFAGKVYIVIGCFIQWKYFPKLLTTKQHANLGELFKFGFSFHHNQIPTSLISKQLSKSAVSSSTLANKS